MIQIDNLPIAIQPYPDGSIVFVQLGNFNTIIDQPETGVQAIISMEDICIGSETIVEYGQQYFVNEHPELLSWINAQIKKEDSNE